MNQHPETPASLIHYTRAPDDDVSPFEVFTRQWRLFARVMVGYGFLAAAVVAVLLALASSYTTYRLPFRFEYKSMEKNLYPNGQTFDATDVLATEVLAKVYETSHLKEQVSLDEFRSCFTVGLSGDEIDKLRRDYQNRISNPKLSVVERDKLEQEYADRVKSLPRDTYGLTFAPPMRSGVKIPPTEAEAAMGKILTTWSDLAVAQGRFVYQINLFSRNILEAGITDSGDYVVSMDMLRVAAERVQKSIKDLSELPGAVSFRTAPGAPSLGELSARVDDLLRYRITPLLSFVRNRGTTSNITATIEYLRGQTYQLGLNSKVLEEKSRNLREVLDQYVRQGDRREASGSTSTTAASGTSGAGVVAQLGDGFLDRMIDISKKSGEQEFRKDMAERLAKLGDERTTIDKEMTYYKDFLKTLEEAAKRPVAETAKDAEYAAAQYKQITEILGRSLDDINALHAGLSQANLRSRSSTFAILGPVERQVEAGLSLKLIAAGLVGAGALVFGVTYLLAMSRTRRLAMTTVT